MAPPSEPRLSAWMILGVLCAPLIFGWLLARRGYSADVRAGAFLLGLISVAEAIVRGGGWKRSVPVTASGWLRVR